MTNRTLTLTDVVYQYYLENSLREEQILQDLRKETQKLSSHKMQIAPEQGQFMAFLVKVLGAKKTIDVGVYTGYSSLVVAMALPQEGKVIACDINEEWTRVARKYWKLANQEKKIDLKIAPAIQTLENLLKQNEQGTYDFVFIDADKKNYEHYYELSLQLLRPGGVVAIDNVLWGGDVADLSQKDENTLAIRAFNKKIYHDSRVFISMIPIADGLMLARKEP